MTIPFSLWTADQDNQKACQQLLGINHRRYRILSDFFQRVARVAPREALPDFASLFSAIAKNDMLFQPDTVMSDLGRKPVSFRTEAELRAFRLYSIGLKKFKAQFADVFKKRGECIAPVFTVEQTLGTTTIAEFPPDLRTFLSAASRLPPVLSGNRRCITFRPAPPRVYDCITPVPVRDPVLTWGSTDGTNLFMDVDTAAFTDINPLGQRFDLLVFARVRDDAIDAATDRSVEKSKLFTIDGAKHKIAVSTSQAFLSRLKRSGWVQYFLVILPAGVDLASLNTLTDVRSVGGNILRDPAIRLATVERIHD